MRPWIKLYATKLNDVRVLRLNERQQLRYYQMYLLAGHLDADGSFIENGKQLDETDIAIKLRISDVKMLTADMKALKDAGLISKNGHGPFISDFSGEQVDWSRKQEQERDRKQKQRHGTVTRDASVTSAKSRNGHKHVTPLDQDQTKKKIKKETKKKKEMKTTTIHNPSSTKKTKPAMDASSSMAGGGGDDSNGSAVDREFEKLINTNSNAAETARIMKPILTADGLGKQKFKTLILKVATRILPRDAKRLTLAAIASAYDDQEAKNKPMIAAHRLENEQVPSKFLNASTWDVIPENILKAAGVHDLNDYVANTGKGVQKTIAMLRAQSTSN